MCDVDRLYELALTPEEGVAIFERVLSMPGGTSLRITSGGCATGSGTGTGTPETSREIGMAGGRVCTVGTMPIRGGG